MIGITISDKAYGAALSPQNASSQRTAASENAIRIAARSVVRALVEQSLSPRRMPSAGCVPRVAMTSYGYNSCKNFEDLVNTVTPEVFLAPATVQL